MMSEVYARDQLEGALRLARHHMLDDHDELSRRWASYHMWVVLRSLVFLGVIDDDVSKQDFLPLVEKDAPPELSSAELWLLYERMLPLVRRCGSRLMPEGRVWARLRSVPKFWTRFRRDLGVVLIIAAALGLLYRKNHGMPIDLWSNEFSLMGVTVGQFSQGYGDLQLNKTVEKVPIFIDGVYFHTGLGTHAESRIEVTLNHSGSRMTGACGYPDSAQGAKIICSITAEGKEIFRSPILTDGARLAKFNIPINGYSKLVLSVTSAQDGINAAHAVWLDFLVDHAP